MDAVLLEAALGEEVDPLKLGGAVAAVAAAVLLAAAVLGAMLVVARAEAGWHSLLEDARAKQLRKAPNEAEKSFGDDHAMDLQ